ncbi:putative RNA-directed DNA polymerase from transposon X-element [Trichonephila clavipes]|nr:putative RNA-directed DNA polymerase from transposon X-element [Trichonephila clavipes]
MAPRRPETSRQTETVIQTPSIQNHNVNPQISTTQATNRNQNVPITNNNSDIKALLSTTVQCLIQLLNAMNTTPAIANNFDTVNSAQADANQMYGLIEASCNVDKSPIGLSLCSWNANGLLGKITELKIFIEKHSPDLILIQETHLRPSHNINIANYICYRNDRPTSNENYRAFGGTLILIKNSIKHYSLPTPSMQTIEATIVILTPIDHDPISIVSIYIPPRSDEYTFTIDIENSFKPAVTVFYLATSMPHILPEIVILTLLEVYASLTLLSIMTNLYCLPRLSYEVRD